jgi:phosphoribosylaminoimidazolecarboxamide formyltransferase/IMP cyclohydrolase
MNEKIIRSALISVYYKEGLDKIAGALRDLNVNMYSTGGTYDYIAGLGIPATRVEDITTYPSILGGRVKTLHPSVFGGILARRDSPGDMGQVARYKIPEIDLVIVDLYPFEKTLEETDVEADIIEKIDIGGISLVRAAAKNFSDVLVIPGLDHYKGLLTILTKGKGITSLAERRMYAAEAFNISSHYDTVIFKYFNQKEEIKVFRESINTPHSLRYGENPHQAGFFYGDIDSIFKRLSGKDISYNNLLDIEAALGMIDEFQETTVVIVKHNNACGVASRKDLAVAWEDALACDPVSAFGGVIAVNAEITGAVASEIDKLFFEVIMAPGYTDEALEILKKSRNRIILRREGRISPKYTFKSLLNGVLWQDKDNRTESGNDMKPVTSRLPSPSEIDDLVFANIIVKHSRSNAIVLAKNARLCASGIGQTSRVDALKQAVGKARSFGFDLSGAVMASDAYFPFADCVEIAHGAGITAVVQPGGSIRDKESIDYCSANGIAMVFTGVRHFKH